MSQYYLINTQKIKSYIDDMDKKDPERTKSYIDILFWNIQDNLAKVLDNPDEFMIEIDHKSKQISFLGDEISKEHRNFFCENVDAKDALYQNLTRSIETIKQKGLEGNLIKEIKPAE